MRSLDFSVDLILPASNRNEYQESPCPDDDIIIIIIIIIVIVIIIINNIMEKAQCRL
jgi:hypothetical protein